MINTSVRREAHHLIDTMSDDVLINLVGLFRSLKRTSAAVSDPADTESAELQAFSRLETMRKEIRRQLPPDFDPDQIISEAREERYGRFN